MKKIIYIIIMIIISLIIYEVLIRCLKIRTEFDYVDERNTVYQYDKEFGWVGIPNIDISYKDIRVINNSLGFRDIEHNYGEKNKKRIMFIGDSFCFGYGVNQDKIFVELLRRKLKDYELFNCGVSGYATDQEYLLLQKYFNIINPDIVFFIYCYNDDIECEKNIVHLGYYKPYYVKVNNKIKLQGYPIPKTWLYYNKTKSMLFNLIFELSVRLKNYSIIKDNDSIYVDIFKEIKNFLNEKNCKFIIASANDNDILKNIGVAYIDLENSNTIDDFGHWDEKGHEYVANKIYNFLKEENIIK